MAVVTLHSLADTRRLGRLLAAACGSWVRWPCCCAASGQRQDDPYRSLDGRPARRRSGRSGSPSFTICNYYPTTPPVLHADLYRSPGSPPEELEEALDDGRSQVILEWAEYLPPQLLPEEYLDISVDACEKGRLLTLTAHGPRAEALLRQTCGQWPGGEA